jgi:hypothetical protein
MFVNCDPATMQAESIMIFKFGDCHRETRPASAIDGLDWLKKICRSWFTWVESLPNINELIALDPNTRLVPDAARNLNAAREAIRQGRQFEFITGIWSP